MRTPSRSLKSSRTDRLRPFNRSKNSRVGRGARPSGRCDDSTLSTVAPAEARRSPHRGPAHSAERSTTTSPLVSSRGGASPRNDHRTPVLAAADSPTKATGSPSSSARSMRKAGSRSRSSEATAAHMAGTELGVASSSSHAGTASMSSARGSDTAMKRSPEERSRQLPPQLTLPRRHSPINAARSARSANPSSPGNDRARCSILSTRPSGGPNDWSGSPVRAIAPLAAQRCSEESGMRAG